MNIAQKIAAPYDVEALRADFPILAERPYGKPLVYLDNAASAQKPRQVLDRLRQAYEHEYSNVHRGLHYLANAATEGYEVARESVRRFLNASSHEEIVFTRNATEAINLVAASFGLDHIREYDFAEPLVFVGGEQPREYWIGIEIGETPPRDTRVAVDEGGGARVADYRQIQVLALRLTAPCHTPSSRSTYSASQPRTALGCENVAIAPRRRGPTEKA